MSASDIGNRGRIQALQRELAVARQTIRSLQDALAAERKDDEALRAAAQELVNSFHKSDGSAFAARDRLVDALEGSPSLASSGSEPEQEDTSDDRP